MYRKSKLLRCGFIIFSVLTYNFLQASLPAYAQITNSAPISQKPNPNQDRFPQQVPVPEPIPPSSEEQPIFSPTPQPTPQATPTTEPTQPSPGISIRKIEVTGGIQLKPSLIEPLTKPLEGRTVTLEELKQVTNAITQLYIERGYITSRAVLEAQEIADGIVKIRIVEGVLEKIEVEGTQRLNPDYIRSRIANGATTPFNASQLEDQLQLLRNDPLFTKVQASIKSGSTVGKSILTVKVVEAPALNVAASIDNYSPPSVGSERLGAAISYRNLTGIGDEISAAYNRTTNGGASLYDFSYRAPINSKNGTIQLRVAPSDSKITDPEFRTFGIRSNNTLYDISYRQPLVRSSTEELALSLGFSLQDGQTFLFENIPFPFGIGADTNGNTRTRVLKFGQDYALRDAQGAWGLRSQFNLGTGLFDATINSGSIPDGRFFSWQGQAQRVQRLGNDNLLIAQADVQLTPDSLLPSQQFVIGGGQSLRGYRQNARSGDNGFRFSLENRIAIQRDETGKPIFQLAPFIDLGAVWNHPDNPNKLRNQTFLSGAGLGIIWEPLPKLTVKADYAIPLINFTEKGNNAQDKGFYFSVIYNP